jgi:hypothetical protein
VAVLRLGHRLGLEPAVSLDNLQERSVVHLGPLLRQLAAKLRPSAPGIDRMLYEPCDFERLWDCVADRPVVLHKSIHAQCGHLLYDAPYFGLCVVAGRSVEEQLREAVVRRKLLCGRRSEDDFDDDFDGTLPGRQCYACGAAVREAWASFVAPEAPRVLHLDYFNHSVYSEAPGGTFVPDDRDRGAVPERLVWAGAAYRLAGAMYWKKRDDADAPGYYGTLIRIASTHLFRLRDVRTNLEVGCEEGVDLIRKTLLHLFYEKLQD